MANGIFTTLPVVSLRTSAPVGFGLEKHERGKKEHIWNTSHREACGQWWIGWIEEVPGVNCQEPTHEELMQSLAETLSEALELNRHALAAAGDDL